MAVLFGLLYLVLITLIIVASGFVVWHLLRYSMDRTLAFTTIVIFLVIGAVLLLVNLSFFRSISFDNLFNTAPSNNSNSHFGL